jgi:hypothetical protein
LEHALGFETKTVYPGERRTILEPDGNTYLTESPALELIKTHAKSLDGVDDVIYVLRDGRDAAASYWHYLRDWEKRPSGRFTEFLQSLYSSGNWWAHHVYAWLELDHPHRVLLVRYEDLHKDQERELRRMLDFLGREPVRQFSDYAANLSFERLHAHLSTFYRSGRIGAWRETFSPGDERFFRQHDLGLLARYGYVRNTECSSDVDSGGGGLAHATKPDVQSVESDAIEIVLKSEIRRTIELERTLEEKESVIRELHAEADRRREALEAVTADRDAWEARYRQLATEHEAVPQSPLLPSHIQRTIELERTLEEKEKAILALYAEAELRREKLDEIDRALQHERAEWAKERQVLSRETSVLPERVRS